MRTKWFIALMIVGAVIAWTNGSVYAQEEEKEEGFEADKGVASIDVSDYPEEMQENYKIFAKRCAKCHTLARPINSNYTGSEWKRYVKRMMRKPGSGINPKNGKKIVEFLVYDTATRKKDKKEEK